ncbi:NACHT domain-containing protein, partial [Streptomyces sp. MCAF7]
LLTQGQQITELGSKIDRVLNGLPQSSDEDTAFQDRYAAYVSRKYGHLEIYGIDLRNSPRSWPLDVAYLSLETTPGAEWEQKTIRAEQILKGCDRALLRGVAGSGKTTLVQWLAVTAARQLTENQAVRLIGDVPFVLPLRTFKHGGSELP